MKALFINYNEWECFKNGLYNSKVKTKNNLFKSKELTELYMNLVIDLWTNSSIHFLSNKKYNRVAWLGQAANSIYCGCSKYETMKNWRDLDHHIKHQANSIATSTIAKWEQRIRFSKKSKNGKTKGTNQEYQTKLLLN